MADVRPFPGLRYNADQVTSLAAVTAPPYDVISPAQQDAFYERDVHNIIRLELTREVPGDSSGEGKYRQAAETLTAWQSEGVLLADERPAIYVYDQEYCYGDERCCRRGLIARVRLEDWAKGVVLPHEVTMAGPKLDRLRLLRAARANLSPIFGMFDDPSGEVHALLGRVSERRPVAQFDTDDGDGHRLWREDDQASARHLSRLLADRKLYIADGHHRYETALAYRDEQRRLHPDAPADAAFNFVMMLLVDVADPGLLLLPTHRLVGHVAPERLSAFLDGANGRFAVHERKLADATDLRRRLDELAERGAAGVHAFGMYGPEPDTFRLLLLRPRHAPERDRSLGGSVSARLDVSVFHRLVLEAELGLTGRDHAGRTGYLEYTRDEYAAYKAVRCGDYQLAFFLNAPPVTAVRDVALAGETMPEKSTYFYPKPLTGLVLNPVS